MDSRSKSVGTVLCKSGRHPRPALMIMGRSEWCLWVPRRPVRALLFLFFRDASGLYLVWPPGHPIPPSLTILPPKPIQSTQRLHAPPKSEREEEKWLATRHLFHLLNKLSVRECAPGGCDRRPGGGRGGRRQGWTASEGETEEEESGLRASTVPVLIWIFPPPPLHLLAAASLRCMKKWQSCGVINCDTFISLSVSFSSLLVIWIPLAKFPFEAVHVHLQSLASRVIWRTTEWCFYVFILISGQFFMSSVISLIQTLLALGICLLSWL